MQRTFEELSVTAITPSPFNPRKDFTGEDFNELVASIAKVGVLEPVLVRPVSGEHPFELVAGERRWRARMAVAGNNGGVESATIPALIQEMDDDLALDIQTIENLQRKDLTGLEEAEAFKIFVDRKGRDAIPELSDRTGIKEPYIRRRLMILGLPKRILSAWGRGDLRFGHLEQLARMNDKQQRSSIFDDLMKQSKHHQVTVNDLMQMIARISPALKSARFDPEACLSCSQNTSVQAQLFDLGDGDPRCNRPKCFKQKQQAHLLKHWTRTKYYRKYGVKGFRFDEDVSWNDYENFWGNDKPAKKCRSCEHHLAILYIDGKSSVDRACFGDKQCFETVRSSKTSTQKSTGTNPQPEEGPRVSWHGEHFREIFFQEQLPQRFESVAPGSLTINQLALFSMIRGNSGVHDWYAERHGVGKALWEGGPMALDSKALFRLIAGMNEAQVAEEIKAVALQSLLSNEYLTDERWLAARHIGIDLSREWRLNQAYLAKKTKGEMLVFGDRFGLFDDPMAMAFLTDTLNRKTFKACKKAELIRVFLESGADTRGMVPDEILADDPFTREEPAAP